MRVILDTNVILSGLMYPNSVPGRILAACHKGAFEWVSSEALAEELGRTLHYPAVSKILKWDKTKIEHFVASLRFQVVFADTDGINVSVPGDPDDDMVLAALIASKADHLVTGDKLLLALAEQYPILNPTDFWKRYGL